MKLILLFALISVAFAKPPKAKIDSSCVKPTSSHAQPPPSIVEVTAAASVVDPSFKSCMAAINGIVESSPTFAEDEDDIESYAKSYLTAIKDFENCDEHPAEARSNKKIDSLKKDFPKLMTAVSQLVSEEHTHTSLADFQSALQSAMKTCSTILTAGEISFEFSHASLAQDEKGINEVTLEDPSIVTQVEQLTVDFESSPSLLADLADIASQARVDSKALNALTEASQWTKTDEWRGKDLKSVVTCYKTLYSAVYPIDQFLSKHQDDASAFSSVVDELIEDPDIVSQVSQFVDDVSSSFKEDREKVEDVAQHEHHLMSDVSYLEIIYGENPSLSCKESALEHDIHSKPSTVVEIEEAISKPSVVKDPKEIKSLEGHYPSVVSACEDIEKVDKVHPSFASVQNSLQEAEQTMSSIITDVEDVISVTSPSLVGDVYDMDRVLSVSPTISSVLDSFSYIFKRSPSLSCAESVIASYASESPSLVASISKDLSDPIEIKKSSENSVAKLTASHSRLVSALRSIDDAKTKFPSITSLESELTKVLSIESSVVSVHQQLTEYDSDVSSVVCSFVPSS